MDTSHVLSKDDVYRWADDLVGRFRVFGPVLQKRNQTTFESIQAGGQLNLDYCSTMLSPRSFIYPSVQKLLEIDRKANTYKVVDPGPEQTQLIFAIHPCDMHAITVLDRTFLGDFQDYYYSKLRQGTRTVVLNCNRACDKGFCPSMGTGPFLKIQEGYDIVMTALGDEFLLQAGSQRGRELIEAAPGVEAATEEHLQRKVAIERQAVASFQKSIDVQGLPELLMQTFDHPVYKEVAEERCLGCTNCTMVCPTCYCYNVMDRSNFGPTKVERGRQWDSCQDLSFAQVHTGNFREPQQARLRQFLTHKLCTWLEQYGCFGCIGCGRCMTWCPTGIDIIDMAKEIQRAPTRGLEQE